MARLVICDDEVHITDILTRFFREKGHEVFGATRGEEALERVLERTTDLVITDIAMKGLSGFDLLKRVRAAGIETPVIITTGNPSHNSAVQALREGAFDYVVKPFHLEEILERTERALMNKRIREENVLYSKLVSLHSISKLLSEADTLDALSARVAQMGARLTRSDAGWYWSSNAGAGGLAAGAAIRPEPESLEVHAYLLRIAKATVDKGDVLVTDTADGHPGDPAWFLSLPVEVGSGIHGVLVFRRPKAQGSFDAVDLEVFNQLGSTFALSIRALGLYPRPEAPPTDAGKTLESWARLVGRLVDEHCLGYESKGQRVASLGRALMRQLHWPEEAARDWDVVCQVYDLPKLRVPQRILDKRKPLTEKEREYIRAQGAWAAECLASIPGLSGTARIVEDSQERFDGTGKPRGAKGHAIAALARLLCVADSFVALLSARPYRAAYSEAQAIGLIRADSGKRFDPEIVLALSKVRET